MFAPRDIREEVERNIESKVKEEAALRRTRAQSEALLARVHILPEILSGTLAEARRALSHHPKDAPFLAVYIETEADAIVSAELDTFDRKGVRRWRLREAVDAVVAFESGTLALAVSGAILDATIDAF